MFSYLVLALGGLLFGAMVYRYDMHEREPWWMLVGAAFAGALTMWGAFELELLIQDLAGASDRSALKAVLAGTLEELAKLAVPVAVLLLMKKHFNDPMDGLIYGSLAGVGAAVFEGAWWQWFAPPQGSSVLAAHGPNAMRLLMHTLWGGVVGSALGLIVMKKPWRQALTRRVALIMLIHFAWDFFLGFLPADEQTGWHRLIAALLVGVSIVWYGLLVVQANKWSRSLHAPTSKQRLVGRVVRMLITRRIR
ncbi:MAG: PrsW family intramembrane metalloprotease [Phycisphaeraceae bacterium]|nr:PrsW family intramembrane metalloprotease [Phycisphaeraceae bacterium]